MSWLRGWRPLLRLAWRDATRARARSTLVLAMIALPVVAVGAADVVLRTADVSSTEGMSRRLGTADAQIRVLGWASTAYQAADPDQDGFSGEGRPHPLPALADLASVLGRPLRGLEVRRDQGESFVETDRGLTVVSVTEVDLADPLAQGLFRLQRGRAPRGPGEAVVTSALADRGPGLGERLGFRGGPELTVVGVGESTSAYGVPMVLAPLGATGITAAGERTWLVDAGGPVTWADVRALNDVGAVVLSRAVLADPPSAAELPAQMQGQSEGSSASQIAVLLLVVAMALIEVVLLAGPAFAVGARRQSRALALMAASGSTPRQTRRAVLAGALVLGGLGAVGGSGLGVLVGWLALPWAQRFSREWFGPFEVPWLHLLGIAALGLLSALLAAVVPAWVASRQDVVAVLAGRRGDRRPSLRSPLLGLLLLVGGAAAAAYGATHPDGGELLIASAAVVAVLGMTLVVPVVVVGLARLSARLPLSMRFALRDAARHRTRTAPAVAAVAATVAGVVALGIALESQDRQGEATYQPVLPLGDAVLVTGETTTAQDGARLRAIVNAAAEGGTVSEVLGISETGRHAARLRVHGPLLAWRDSRLGSDVLVADTVPAGLPGLTSAARERADAALARGDVVAFANSEVPATSLRVTVRRRDENGRWTDRVRPSGLTVSVARVPRTTPSARAVVPSRVARELGLTPRPVAIYVTGAAITPQRQRDATEAIQAIAPYRDLYVERGYQRDPATRVVILVLTVLAGVLMLGGSLTATFLSLADARPDLATLSAVGAPPARRRSIAAAYALAVGLVGGLLGAAVGFIPGVAISFPLTATAWGAFPYGEGPADAASVTDHYLAVPWPLITLLVLGLPLATAVLVALATRSRLPMVARLA